MGQWITEITGTTSDGGTIIHYAYQNLDGSIDRNGGNGWVMPPDNYTANYNTNEGLRYSGNINEYQTSHLGGTNLFATITTTPANKYLSWYFNAKITVPAHDFKIASNLKVDIPFPYKHFTDTAFFVTDQYGTYIADKYYTRINDTQIQFSGNSPLGLFNGDEVRFIFCHNHNQYAVMKSEIHLTTTNNTRTYKFVPPYAELVDLDTRTKVFYKRKLVLEENKDYAFNNKMNAIILSKNLTVNGGEDLDILIFYTGHINTKSINNLPQSGYIYLKKHEIDRNYNRKMMCVFVNGKLIPKSQITDMTNNIHKINTDIKSTYDLHVLGMSPKIEALVPFYKSRYMFDKGRMKHETGFDIFGQIKVFGYSDHHNRYKLDRDANPIIPLDILNKYPDAWFGLMHHGITPTESVPNLVYSAKFYEDDFVPDSQTHAMDVILELRYKSNDESTQADSLTSLILTQIPGVVTQSSVDVCYNSVKIKSVLENDYTRKNLALDGIYCKMKIRDNTKGETTEYPVYYYFEASNYETYNTVQVFEWVITSGVDGTGEVYWKKAVTLIPFNRTEIEDSISSDEDDE